jgi:hypothetical protein
MWICPSASLRLKELNIFILIFIFGVLHPVAHALSRLSEKPSLATTVQGVYCIYTLTATCFSPHWPSSCGTHNIIHKEVIILTTDPLSVVQIALCTLFGKCCRRLFKCDCEVSTRECNNFLFIILDVENVAAK